MSAIYSKANEETSAMGHKLIGEYHLDLKSARVRIDYIFAHSVLDEDGNPTGPAITKNGYPAQGLVRKLSAKDRVMGRGDCEIVLDGDVWRELSYEEQIALLDHELEHVLVRKDKYGAFIADECGRPCLKLKKHDHQFGWFNIIAQRHGEHSAEIKQFRQFFEEESGQIYFAFVAGTEAAR